MFTLNGCSDVEGEAVQRIPWEKWEPMTGDCLAIELEVTHLIDSWRARSSPDTRLLEARFQYDKTRCISLLMEIEVPHGPVLRTIVGIGYVAGSFHSIPISQLIVDDIRNVQPSYYTVLG